MIVLAYSVASSGLQSYKGLSLVYTPCILTWLIIICTPNNSKKEYEVVSSVWFSFCSTTLEFKLKNMIFISTQTYLMRIARESKQTGKLSPMNKWAHSLSSPDFFFSLDILRLCMRQNIHCHLDLKWNMFSSYKQIKVKKSLHKTQTTFFCLLRGSFKEEGNN